MLFAVWSIWEKSEYLAPRFYIFSFTCSFSKVAEFFFWFGNVDFQEKSNVKFVKFGLKRIAKSCSYHILFKTAKQIIYLDLWVHLGGWSCLMISLKQLINEKKDIQFEILILYCFRYRSELHGWRRTNFAELGFSFWHTGDGRVPMWSRSWCQ